MLSLDLPLLYSLILPDWDFLQSKALIVIQFCVLSSLYSIIKVSLQQKFLSGVSAAFFLDVSQQSKTEHGSAHEMNIAFYIIVKCKKAILNAI